MKGLPMQEALLARLGAVAALTAIVGSRIYDRVPQDATFPYVELGEDTLIPWDTHSSKGVQATATLHSWSRYQGRKEIKNIQQAIYDGLHQHALVVAGAVTVDCYFEFAESILDPDGLTRHGIQRFRITLDEV